MRTLKRTMCLVLAMVMLLGLCAIQASAVDTNLGKYQDQDQITYKEAVDVLTGIDVMEGDANGFRPTDKVTRAEAAAIITRLLIGNAEAARALKADVQVFSDVPVTNWAAGYISYCYERGIINGRGNGTFGPSDNVTGIEFGKMLLSAIGYGSSPAKEYTGAAWAINVAKDGVQYGIYEGHLAGASEVDATREECALYAFNTLTLSKVTYSSLYGGYIENVAGLAGSPNQAQSNKASTIAGDYELSSTEFGRIGRLQNISYSGPSSVDSDMFYRPVGHYWYQRSTINSVSDYYGGDKYLLKTFNEPVTGADLFDAIGSNLVSRIYSGTLRLYIYENGVSYSASNPGPKTGEFDIFANGMKDSNGNNQIRRANNTIMAHTGYGVETSVYAVTDRSGDVLELRITLVHSYLGQVDDVKGAVGNIPAYIRVKYANNTDYVTYNGNAKFTDTEVDATNYVKGDYILFSYSFRSDHPDKNPGIQEDTVRLAKKDSSRITSYTNYTDSYRGFATIRAAGETFYPALDDSVFSNQTMARNINRTYVNEKEYTIFSDGNGHIIGVDAVVGRKDFVFVTEFGYRFTTGANDMREKLTLTARAYDAEGKEEILYVDTSTAANNNREYTSLNGFYSNGNIVGNNDYGWESRAMVEGEKPYVARLNGETGLYDAQNNLVATAAQCDARGLYYRASGADGKYILMDLESYAKEKARADADALGENRSYYIGTSDVHYEDVFRGVAGLRRVSNNDLSTTVNTNYASSRDVNLYANANTVFFYVGKDKAGNPDMSKKPTVYVGISNVETARTTVAANGTRTENGSIAWYGEYTFDSNDIYNSGNTNVAYAQVVLVVKSEQKSESVPPVFVYLDDNDGANRGSYRKYAGEDRNSWYVDYNVYVAGESTPTIKTVKYTSESRADSAIRNAANLINDWVTVNDGENGGLEDWNDKSPKNLGTTVGAEAQKWNKTDKLWYVDETEVYEIRDTNRGETIFYESRFDSSSSQNENHYLGTEITGNEQLFDVRRNISEDERITSLTELDNVAKGKDNKGNALPAGETWEIRVLIAYDEDLFVKAVYVVDIVKNRANVPSNDTIQQLLYRYSIVDGSVVTYVTNMLDGKEYRFRGEYANNTDAQTAAQSADALYKDKWITFNESRNVIEGRSYRSVMDSLKTTNMTVNESTVSLRVKSTSDVEYTLWVNKDDTSIIDLRESVDTEERINTVEKLQKLVDNNADIDVAFRYTDVNGLNYTVSAVYILGFVEAEAQP